MTNIQIPVADLHKSIIALLDWLSSSGYKGYDPYDALSSPWIYRLDKSSSMIGRIAIQILKSFPFNLRSLLGIPKEEDAKALGLLGRGYFHLWNRTKDDLYWEKGTECLARLDKLVISGYSGACWAHPFPYRSRRLYLAANSPSVVSTVYAAQAFVDAYERKREMRWLEVARSACDFILKDLERIGTERNFCFSYVPNNRLAVHNANLLAVQLLARVSKLTGDDWKQIISAALNYTVSDQNADGSWYYDGPDSPSRSTTFIDGFHTGFVLESLWEISKDTGVDLNQSLYSGFDFYVKYLFESNGKPYRTIKHGWSVDLRDCAQALIVFSIFSESDERASKLINQVLKWTVQHMQSPKGYFYFTRDRWWVSPIPYVRFQAWMLCALATVLSTQKQKSI